MSNPRKFKVKDVVKVVKDLDVENNFDDKTYIGDYNKHLTDHISKVGIIISIDDEGKSYRPYYIDFKDNFKTYYGDEEIRLATQYESDRFHLMRFVNA